MKHLILLRHAKAVAKDEAHDFDRALSSEGQAEMKPVAAYVSRTVTPDVALVSPARRTRETWDLARAGLPQAGGTVATTFDKRLYEAPANNLLAVIREADASAGSVMLVGHNPGISDLALDLAGEAGRLLDGMPTGSIVAIDFDAADWTKVGKGQGRLVAFVSPSELGSGRAG